MITLGDFLLTVGDQPIAELLGVKTRTVQSWRLGERSPRPEWAERLILLAAGHPAGPITWAGIYARENRKRHSKWRPRQTRVHHSPVIPCTNSSE